MDHLPATDDSKRLSVVCLCPEGYDGYGFQDFPLRKGWDQNQLFRRDFGHRAPGEVAKFLQSWLYFGLLFEIFWPVAGQDYNQSDFMEDTPSSVKIISTKKLPQYVKRWRAQEQDNSSEWKRIRFNRIRSCLVLVYLYARQYSHHTPVEQHLPLHMQPLSPEIVLSIIILGDTLTHAGFQILGYRFDLDWGFNMLLVDQMKGSGWCPRVINTCLRGQQIQNLWYASTFEEPWSRQDHKEGGCYNHVCKWEQIDNRTYNTKHRPRCTDCALSTFAQGDFTKLISIIENDGIPLIHCRAIGETTQISIHDNKELTKPNRYVAISHVWSHGLGNTKESSLQTCQCMHIQSLVSKCLDIDNTSDDVYWWCDTICVPVGPEYERQRKKAITVLPKIYQQASHVLVLDRGLEQISSVRPATELYIRLKMSSWMGRLWTLSEGVLAKSAYVQFSDRAISIGDLESTVIEDAKTDQSYLYQRYSFLCKQTFGPFIRGLGQAKLPRFMGIWKAIQHRATSYRRDEAVCLCQLLSLDPSSVLDTPETQLDNRMAEFFKLYETIPLAVVFQPTPKLAVPGFKWAPASFLNCFRENAMNPSLVVDGAGKIGSSGVGLTVQASALSIAAGTDMDVRSLFASNFVIRAPDAIVDSTWSILWMYPGDEGPVTELWAGVNRRAVVLLLQPISANDVDCLGILGYRCDEEARGDCIGIDFVAPVKMIANKIVPVVADGRPDVRAHVLVHYQLWRLL